MAKLDFTNATATDYTNTADFDVKIPTKEIDGSAEQDETDWYNSNCSTQYGYFAEIPELNSAIKMKAIWNVGKGYTTEDSETKITLEHISGWGKDTFEDILFNMCMSMRIYGDAFAEIIKDKETGKLINLKPLNNSDVHIIVNGKGIIKRYEIHHPAKNKEVIKKQPDEILHFCNNRINNQIHGISEIDCLQKSILAEYENFDDMQKVMHRQVKPFIIFKIKSDDATKIDALVKKVNNLRKYGEDLFIPDDENILSYEVVQVNISEIVLAWRNDIKNKFYRAMGLPQIVFGSAGTTESGGKIEYLAHEQIFEHDQRYIEQQLWNQLAIKIDLVSPVSLLESLRTDENKDQQNALAMQQSDMMAGNNMMTGVKR